MKKRRRSGRLVAVQGEVVDFRAQPNAVEKEIAHLHTRSGAFFDLRDDDAAQIVLGDAVPEFVHHDSDNRDQHHHPDQPSADPFPDALALALHSHFGGAPAGGIGGAGAGCASALVTMSSFTRSRVSASHLSARCWMARKIRISRIVSSTSSSGGTS